MAPQQERNGMSGEKGNKLVSLIMNGLKSAEAETEPREEIAEPLEEAPEASEMERIEEDVRAIRDQLEGDDRVPAMIERLDSIEASLEEIRLAIGKQEQGDEGDGAMEEVREAVRELLGRKADPTKYMTSREQMKTITAAVERRDAEVSDKAFLRTMEQVAMMREDFNKLCGNIREKAEEMSAEKVLSSFEAYKEDLENILFDGGVFIGPFPYDKLNAIHQRIVGVVPTEDREMDGMIAERLSDGYKLGGRVLVKERVMIYRSSDFMSDAKAESKTVSEESGKLEEEE